VNVELAARALKDAAQHRPNPGPITIDDLVAIAWRYPTLTIDDLIVYAHTTGVEVVQ
jgi:hypothetical protein